MSKIKVAVLGATGAVGQRFVQLLENHPWFEVTALTGSDRSVGQLYGDACRWVLDKPLPDYARNLRVVPTEPGLEAAIVFSALPSDQAKAIEPAFAQAGHGVCSNASSYRMDDDVPLLIPEVNPDHTALIKVQQQQRGWSGFIATNPNCTSTGFTIAFRPLLDTFGIKKLSSSRCRHCRARVIRAWLRWMRWTMSCPISAVKSPRWRQSRSRCWAS